MNRTPRTITGPKFEHATARHAFAGFVLVSMVAAMPLPARASDGAGSAGGSPVALNQSVVLDEKAAPTAEAPGPARTSGHPPAVGERDDTLVTSSGPITSREIERRTAPEGGVLRGTQRAQPWYRTGLGALTVVLVLVAGIYWLARRWMPVSRLTDSRAVRVVARASLSPKHHAVLVQLGRRFVMVGLSPNGATPLCEITDPDEVAELLGRTTGRPPTGSSGFDAGLLRELSQYRDDLEPQPAGPRPASLRGRMGGAPLSDLLQRLRALRAR